MQLAQAVLASAERLVNDMSARARHDTLSNSEKEVHRAERRLKATLARLREFRDREGIIDPRKTADATQALADRTRDEIVRADTELSTAKAGDSGVPIGTDENPTLTSRFRVEAVRCARYRRGTRPILNDT